MEPDLKKNACAIEPFRIFVCHAPEDEESLLEFKKHLAPTCRQGRVELWSYLDVNFFREPCGAD